MWALSTSARTMTAPLQGIRIVDLSAVFSGPMAAALLSDQGAEVIKVESLDGDTTRNIGPAKGDHPPPLRCCMPCWRRPMC
jgi:crotonobetainyl-CoA:carnitine CoA-transferase CaiB-like acyl-CoA transferase